MITDLDRLEIELRCVPGVFAVGLDRDDATDGLLVQAVVLATAAGGDLSGRLQRVVDANVREPVSLEIVVESRPAPPGA